MGRLQGAWVISSWRISSRTAFTPWRTPGLYLQLHVVFKLKFLGRVVSLLTQPTTYQILSIWNE